MNVKIPPVPKDLLDHLQKTFPDRARRSFGPEDNIVFEAGWDAGVQQVLDHLRFHFERQEKANHVCAEN